jgi:hypothetical protein
MNLRSPVYISVNCEECGATILGEDGRALKKGKAKGEFRRMRELSKVLKPALKRLQKYTEKGRNLAN